MIRSTLVLVASTLSMTAGLLVTPGAVADDSSDRPTTAGEQSVITAQRVLQGDASAQDPSPTMALRDVWLARGDLSGRDLTRAEAMLARPTDGPNDPNGFGYTVPEAVPVCSDHLCIHHVDSTVDAPPSPQWVDQTLAVMERVWQSEVDSMGFQPPLGDGIRGGSPLLDVYLKDLGGQIYGYCAPEGRRGHRASGFCVLDNDFSSSQFPMGDPVSNLTVTAAHEFFHAIQFGYDAREDGWMLESTATWMEERVATEINDSRQYLKLGQLYRPRMPLDVYDQNGYQYGNWIFWEYLTNNYGNQIVKRAWKQAAKNGGRKYSMQVLTRLLRPKGGLPKVYAAFANASLTPAAAYPEGAAYRLPGVATTRLGRHRSVTRLVKVDHLASRSFAVRPGGSVKGGWRLQVSVDGPAAATSPAVALSVHKRGGRVVQRFLQLNKRGDGRLRVQFDRRKVTKVSITAANASTRYRCSTRNIFACRGTSRDDGQRFTLRARTVR